jgi:hypothetical protein
VNPFAALVTMLAALGDGYEPAPPPEEIDIKDTYARIREKHPDIPREGAFMIIELFIERELTDGEKLELV